MSSPEPAPTPTAVADASGRPTDSRQRLWDRRAHSWDHAAVGLGAVVETVMSEAAVERGMVVVDLGAGTGSLSLPLAALGASVTAVDISPKMMAVLEAKAKESGIDGIAAVVAKVEELDLPDASVDVVVSNYALHHLRDPDKEKVVVNAARWLRPGGRLVVGDMMFGRGSTTRDREVIASKMRIMLRRGPAGWWRLAKNVARFTLRLQERPVPIDRWKSYFAKAGFTAVTATAVVDEAAVVAGTKLQGAPGPSAEPAGP